MTDNSQYAKVRDKVIDMLRNDLRGPLDENEVLHEFPCYIVGKLAPQQISGDADFLTDEQEIDTDAAYDENSEFTSDEDDNDEFVFPTRFKTPSSIGISFYLESSTPSVNIDISWGDYLQRKEKIINKDAKETTRTSYVRHPMKETRIIEFSDFPGNRYYPLECDPNVCLYISRVALESGCALVSAYVINKRTNSERGVEANMFQVEIKAYAPDNSYIFVAEHRCKKVLTQDEYYFEQRPVFGRGRGCAAIWGTANEGKTSYVKSDFIPEYEIPDVSPVLPGFDNFYFSMRFMSVPGNRNETVSKLNALADTYEEWIKNTLAASPKMADKKFRERIGEDTIGKCRTALERIREGIMLLEKDDIAFDAFCFMNQAMVLQRNIMNYAKKHGSNPNCSFRDFTRHKVSGENDFGWYPFQIAFILMNLNAVVDPLHKDREIVDLLYFPTGGGKTEAYLGLMAFVIANRRLRINDEDDMNRDGGVTIILRYTLRLLTTQQRDRIIRMIIAAEMIRKREALKGSYKYGREPISIGFWVGSGVTPNTFKDLEDDPEDPNSREGARHRNHIRRQLLTCPFCGTVLSKDEFIISSEEKSVRIYCPDKTCIFARKDKKDEKDEKQEMENNIPVYMVDEEIYAKCPTVILSTVDKFAVLPWELKTGTLFGRVNRFSERDGYIAAGDDEHPSRHNKTKTLRAAAVKDVKPFFPPELIIQDELHLITGPLGTIYGAYETVIEDLCSYRAGSRIIRPKYIVSTATIRNAEEQIKSLYARRKTAQFPPNGFEIGDSLFIKEIPVEKAPFRKYVGVAAPGQSVKRALLFTYAILLQGVYSLLDDEKYRNFIDPYYTLIGYYNSIRELGGTVRLLQDDIPKRIKQIRNQYKMKEIRRLKRKTEITSRMHSYDIPNKLKQLETGFDPGYNICLDTVIATNMIAVGMDVNRLGLMVVSGQPKQNSEYIQATSRIGRVFPGLVVTLYNPYRPRDLSHYENFTGYHAQLYRFVEGTTATPFSDRARDRVIHALIIAAIRLRYPDMASNKGAANIANLSDEQIQTIKEMILYRLNIVKPAAREDASNEIDIFIDQWIRLAEERKGLRYYLKTTERYNRLMNYYGENVKDSEKATMISMRDVEKAANMYYYYHSAED